MARAVDARDEPGPERTCIVTRVKRPPEAMIRFVLAPDGRLVADVARRLPGRGVWISPDARLLEKAMASKAFSRAFKGQADVPSGLVEEVDTRLEADALQWLSLANKANHLVAGFSKVEAALARGGVAALIHALDGSADGAKKIDRIARREAISSGAEPANVGIFDSLQLDLALGRPNVVHAALTTGPTTRAFLARCRRLALFRGLAWRDPVTDERTLGDAAPPPAAVPATEING